MPTLSIQWSVGADNFTATADAAGNITGAGAGKVYTTEGRFEFRPNKVPPKGTQATLSYTSAQKRSGRVFDGEVSGGNYSRDFGLISPMLRGSFESKYHFQVTRPPSQVTLQAAGKESKFVEQWYAQNERRAVQATDVPPSSGNTGTLAGVTGTIDYTTGIVLAGYPQASAGLTVPIDTWGTEVRRIPPASFGGSWTNQNVDVYLGVQWVSATASLIADALADATYLLESDTTTSSAPSMTFDEFEIDLVAGGRHTLMPNSVSFTWGGKTYFDKQGVLYTDLNITTGIGVEAGTVDYSTGVAKVTAWAATNFDYAAPVMLGLQGLTTTGVHPIGTLTARTQAAPIRSGAFQLLATTTAGVELVATADSQGVITSTPAGVTGAIDYETGVFVVKFASLVNSDSLRYNATAYTFLPLSKDIIGLDTVRLPVDGRVPIFEPGRSVVVHHTDKDAVGNTLTAGQVFNAGRERLSSAVIADSSTPVKYLPGSMYSVDLDAGTLTILAGVSTTGLTAPFFLEHRIEDMVLVSDATIDGTLQFTRAISHDYPANESYVSSALEIGNLQARVYNIFEQETWLEHWLDTLEGDAPLAQFNNAAYPAVATNQGAIKQRWALIFTSSSAFKIVGEQVGQVGTGDINTNVAPVNPLFNAPYFTLDHRAFGSGWPVGAVLRFNTDGADFPFSVVRTVLQSAESSTTGGFEIEGRVSINQ